LTFAKASDETLIAEYLKTRKNKYFDLLYNKYKDKVYGKCLSMLTDAEKSQDAVQDIFLSVMLNLSSFKQNSRFSTWLYSITYNHCIDVIRKGGKMVFDSLETMEISQSRYDESEIEEKKLLDIKVERLDQVLDTIPVRDKSILIMKYQGGLSIREISEMLGKSESAIKMTLKRAKERSVKVYNELFID
jgi:RNA polymerase sigma-70 factor (ECF subfamily)